LVIAVAWRFAVVAAATSGTFVSRAAGAQRPPPAKRAWSGCGWAVGFGCRLGCWSRCWVCRAGFGWCFVCGCRLVCWRCPRPACPAGLARRPGRHDAGSLAGAAAMDTGSPCLVVAGCGGPRGGFGPAVDGPLGSVVGLVRWRCVQPTCRTGLARQFVVVVAVTSGTFVRGRRALRARRPRNSLGWVRAVSAAGRRAGEAALNTPEGCGQGQHTARLPTVTVAIRGNGAVVLGGGGRGDPLGVRRRSVVAAGC
jgi:hypothetical protein